MPTTKLPLNNSQSAHLQLTQLVFERAIAAQLLSANESEPNYAGAFMYMYSQEGKDYFKHILTRKYGHNQATILQATKL